MMEMQIEKTTLLFKPDPQPDSPDQQVCVGYMVEEGGGWWWKVASGSGGVAADRVSAWGDLTMAVS